MASRQASTYRSGASCWAMRWISGPHLRSGHGRGSHQDLSYQHLSGCIGGLVQHPGAEPPPPPARNRLQQREHTFRRQSDLTGAANHRHHTPEQRSCSPIRLIHELFDKPRGRGREPRVVNLRARRQLARHNFDARIGVVGCHAIGERLDRWPGGATKANLVARIQQHFGRESTKSPPGSIMPDARTARTRIQCMRG
jgi:hypothetical protein